MAPKHSLRAISQAARSERPVFIAGVPRSGTTALRATLAHHPAFHGITTRGPETGIFVHPSRILQLLEPKGERLFRYLIQDVPTATAILDTLGRRIPKRSWMRRGRFAAKGEGTFTTDGFADMVRVFFHFAKELRGCRRILEKTPAHVYHLPEIFETFPHAHVVLCVRDPVDTLESFRRRWIRQSSDDVERRDDWLNVTTAEFADRYEREANLIVAHREARRNQVSLVNYEDLTRDATGEIARICHALGETPVADDLQDRDELRREDGSPKPQGKIVKNEHDGERHVTPEDVDLLRRRLDPIAMRVRSLS